MTKRVEFHQAQIQVVFRVVDDERSYGLPTMQAQVVVDTDAEWADVRRQIEEARAEYEAKLAEAKDGD